MNRLKLTAICIAYGAAIAVLIGCSVPEEKLQEMRHEAEVGMAPGAAVITAQKRQDGHYIPVTLNGKTAPGLVDTGAVDMLVPYNVAKAAGVRVGAFNIEGGGVGGSIRMANGYVDTLTIGGRKFSNIRVTVTRDFPQILVGLEILDKLQKTELANGELKIYLGTPAEPKAVTKKRKPVAKKRKRRARGGCASGMCGSW